MPVYKCVYMGFRSLLVVRKLAHTTHEKTLTYVPKKQRHKAGHRQRRWQKSVTTPSTHVRTKNTEKNREKDRGTNTGRNSDRYTVTGRIRDKHTDKQTYTQVGKQEKTE